MAFVHNVASDEEYAQILATAEPGKLVVTDFTATWCGPCKAIKPFYAELAKRFTNVQFLAVDIDKLKATAQANQVTSVPTFNFHKNNQLVASIKGANPKKLEELVQQHQSSAEGSSGSSSAGLGGHVDLTQFVDTRQVECLNQSDKHTVKSIFTKESAQYLESDVDEQLIITIPFNQAIKLHSIKISAPIDQAPAAIRTFVNKATAPSFDEVETIEATEVIELAKSSYQIAGDDKPATAIIPLRYVKYQSVHSVTIFVGSNISGADTSIITELNLIGSPIESTKALSELKKEHDHE